MARRDNLTAEEIATILTWYDQGDSLRIIARGIGVDHSCIRYHLVKEGVEIRKRGGANHRGNPVVDGRLADLSDTPPPTEKKRHTSYKYQDLFDEESRRCTGKTYQEYLRDAVDRGDETIQAVTGLQPTPRR